MTRSTPAGHRKAADTCRARINRRVISSLGKPKNKLSDSLAFVAAALKVCSELPDAFNEIAKCSDQDAISATRDAAGAIQAICREGLEVLPGAAGAGQNPPADNRATATAAGPRRISTGWKPPQGPTVTKAEYDAIPLIHRAAFFREGGRIISE